MSKEKKQRFIAKSLILTGIGLEITSLYIGISHLFNGPQPPSVEITGYMGLGLLFVSIPFIVAADKNRKKAKRLNAVIEMRNSNFINQMKISKIYYPSFSLKLHL